MERLLSSGLLLLIAGLLACSGSPTTTPAESLTPTNQHTPKPNTNATPTPEPLPQILQDFKNLDQVKQFSDAPDRNLFQLTKELVPGRNDLSMAVVGDDEAILVGHTETFWLVDLTHTKTYQSDFTLALVTPHAYWYVEDSLEVSMLGLERSAERFEENIYPVITQIFGSEWNPGIDNDSRLNILNARLSKVAGYFSSTDEYPTSIQPRSNEREIIYVNAQNVLPGSANYDQVLSHELQHAIHWNADASEDVWVNEGLAELATSIALHSTFSIRQFLQSAPVSLINWPTSSVGRIAHYGAASLFMHFFTENYGGRDDLTALLIQPEDSIAGINGYLEEKGYTEGFEDVFKQWAVANVLDEHLEGEDTILGYDDLEISAVVSKNISGLKEKQSEMPQYAVEYIELKSLSEPFQLSFKGDADVALLPIEVKEPGCWWSNSGDSIDSTLSRRIDLPTSSTAILEYEVWFEIEEGWDYVYVEVSIDGGDNWRIIETSETSPANPMGNAFGPGYTGKSGGWLTDSIDLTPFAGEDLWVRFQYITDDAINAAGACFRDLFVTESGITAGDVEWEPEGFVFTENIVRQDFQVQLITVGDEPLVRQLTLDTSNAGRLIVRPPGDGEQLVVAVGSLAEKTRELANYTIRLTPN